MQVTEAYLSDSDDSIEGFIENSIRVEIDPSIQKQPQQQRPVDMEARFLSGLGFILRKQPSQVYKTVDSLDQYKQQIAVKMQRRSRKVKERVRPLYQKYTNPDCFRLVYSRLKSKILPIAPSDFTFFLVPMDHLIQYKEENYTALRQFKRNSKVIDNSHLTFESRFQSGNLIYSYQCVNNAFEYHLLMQNDTNTKGYNQWFYFSVQGMKAGQTYTFKIVNFKKKHSLFAEGMRPFVFSIKKHSLAGNGWSNILQNVTYQSAGTCVSTQDAEAFYQLSFDIHNEHSDDYVLISMGMPYSYSKLMEFLRSIKPAPGIQLKQRILAHSISNNPVPIITITAANGYQSKKIICLVARQHPGQTWSSYLMEGIINHLLGSSEQAQYLRQRFVFEIIPMLNVDGVIYGNFRCDLNGFDLNRQWKTPHRAIHPQVWALKNHIRNLSQTIQYQMFLDLHGHSKKYNTFCYTCKEDPYSCRVLPLLISKLSPIFYFPDCTYGIDKSKANTARAFVFNTIKKVNVLTIECSFYGKNIVKTLDKNIQSAEVFKPKDMFKLGQDIIKAIHIYQNGPGDYKKSEIEAEVIAKAKQFADYDRRNQNDSGSQSDPYSDQMDEAEYQKILTTRVLSAISSDRDARVRRAFKKNTEIQGKSITVSKPIKPVTYQSKRLVLPEGRKIRQATMTEEKRKKSDSTSPRKRESYVLKTQKIIHQDKGKSTQKNMEMLNPFTQATDEQPKIMFRTRNAIFLNKPNIKSSFKEFSFVESEDKIINHNRLQSQLMESRYTEVIRQKRRSPPENKSLDKSKLLSKYTNEAINKKIEQELYPLLQQRSIYQALDSPERRGEVRPPETSDLTYQRAARQQNNYSKDWITESNNIFHLQKRPKNNIVNFQKFHKKGENDKNQRHYSSSNKRNFVRYEKAEDRG